jgi:sialate O-acetylesterase
MVVQREKPVCVRGRADPGKTVTVKLSKRTASAIVSTNGAWSVSLPPFRATGEPMVLEITDGTTTRTCTNIVAGDIWLCSGQSNMWLPLKDADGAEAALATCADPLLRLMQVGLGGSLTPVTAGAAVWASCGPEKARDFSAVGYFFGREVREKSGVPIGMINASVGGTPIQSWMPPATARALPALAETYAAFAKFHALYTVDKAAYEAETKRLRAQHEKALVAWRDGLLAGDDGEREKWWLPSTDTARWTPVTLPAATPADGFTHLGSVWFRQDARIPESWVGKPLEIGLAAIDDVDVTCVNGVQVGRTWYDAKDFWKTPRRYSVPADLIKGTGVCVVVRMFNIAGVAGFFGTNDTMFLRPAGDAAAAPVSLAGAWTHRVDRRVDLASQPKLLLPVIPGDPEGGAFGSLYNGMIHPLTAQPIRGVIWYQAESNDHEPALYAELFPALISGWRAAWNDKDMPFYFTQLAGFMARQSAPVEYGTWADLRAAQMSALKLPHVAAAAAHDIGNATDIHPRNKKEVGRRLALLALANEYAKNIVCYGPTLAKMKISGETVKLTFDHAKGLRASDGGELHGFAVAGEDKQFRWARAEIKGDTVTLAAPEVPKPVAVRYNWASNPVGNLVNAEALPALPFRTDSW